jgi:hypothetical protein
MYIKNWVDKNYIDLKNKLKSIKSNNWEDIFQEVIIQFLVMDKQKAETLIDDGVAFKYIMGMFKLNVYSKTSPYHWKYNRMVYDKNFNFDNYDLEDEKYISGSLCLADVDVALNLIDEHFVYKLVYLDYIERKSKQAGYSIKKISVESEITKPTLVVKFGELKSEIKKIINEL